MGVGEVPLIAPTNAIVSKGLHPDHWNSGDHDPDFGADRPRESGTCASKPMVNTAHHQKRIRAPGHAIIATNSLRQEDSI